MFKHESVPEEAVTVWNGLAADQEALLQAVREFAEEVDADATVSYFLVAVKQ